MGGIILSYKVGSMFAGIGGTCLGFIQAGAEVVWANEIDKYACTTYRLNFGNQYLQEGDITTIKKHTIPEIDILIGGFPCQAFSIAGYRKGFEDERGNVFFQIVDVIKGQAKKPKAIMLENVKNLIGHDKGKTYKVIEQELKSLGYFIKYMTLNSMEYGDIPQNRERVYIVGFLSKEELGSFETLYPVPLSNTLSSVINRNSKVDDKYYYDDSSKYFSMLKEAVIDSKTIYQLRRIYVRENKSNVCPTLTANMGTGGHNVPIILDYHNKIRKLTPRECLLLQGFPVDYHIPKGMADSHIYKQAGNSVTVPVVKRIASNIIKVLDEHTIKVQEARVLQL